MFLAFIMDLVVWSKAHRIDIAPEDNGNKLNETESNKTNPNSPDTQVQFYVIKYMSENIYIYI